VESIPRLLKSLKIRALYTYIPAIRSRPPRGNLTFFVSEGPSDQVFIIRQTEQVPMRAPPLPRLLQGSWPDFQPA